MEPLTIDSGRRALPTLCSHVLLALVVLTIPAAVAAQTPPPADVSAIEAAAAAAAVEPIEVGPPVILTYANRPIVQLRSFLIGRPPAERVAGARLAIDRLVEASLTGPVETQPTGTLISLVVAGRRIVTITPGDVDTLAGETPDGVAAAAASRLEVAMAEAVELRRPRQLLVATLLFLAATATFAGIIWTLRKARVVAGRRIASSAERRLHATRVGDAEFVRSSRILEFVNRSVDVLIWSVGLFVGYAWLTFSLRRFPFTRPWGESLRSVLLDRLTSMGIAIVDALPGLFTVLLIVLITKFVIRIMQLLFLAVEDGRVALPWMYPETAQPTRKILTVGLWLFAVTIAYPYLPGSESEAFKGMSVFVGLVLSLGSSGIVNQVMSGFTLTYSRALRVGDFVSIGEIEGSVTQVGTLSTKITTMKGEDVTIPNTVVVSQTVTNYSRFADTHGVYVATDITIGYDVPWRQVEALLLLAANRTPGVRRDQAPRVREAALEDFYIRYTLQFCPELPTERRKVLAAVHASILDAFNEYGVQITSPNYEADPERPKVVPREQWFAAPAAQTAEPTLEAPGSVIRT